MLNALKRLRIRIATAFYRYGKNSTEYTVINILVSSLIVLFLTVPAASWYSKHRAAEYYRLEQSAMNTNFWDSPYHISAMQDTNLPYVAPVLGIQQIHFVTTDGQITKRLLKQILEFDNKLMDTTAVTSHGKKVSMVDICYQMQGRCVVHSALDIWNDSLDELKQDIDITGTILNHVKKTSARSGLSLHPATLFGNATLDVLGQPISADSVLVTFLLREGPLRQKYREEWNSIWDAVTADLAIPVIETFNAKPSTPFYKKCDIEMEQFQYKYNSESIPLDSEIWILLITYGIIFTIVAVAFGNVQLVKSKYGLALAAVFETVACLSATLGIFTLAGLSFAHVPFYIIPLVIIIATIENVFVVTNAMLHSGCDMPIKEKVGRGLEALGFAITATLLAELSILVVGSHTGLQAVKEFCQFTAIALVIDYILQLTFFVSVLSVDIRRVELTDLDDRNLSKRVHLINETDDLTSDGKDSNEYCPMEETPGERPNCAACKGLKTHRAVTALVICSSILLLSVFSPQTPYRDQSAISLERYVHMDSISTNFWNVINPSYGVRFIEVRSPILVALDASEETFEHLQRINDVFEFESASKRAHEAEIKNQSSIQRFGFQLIRRFVTIIVSINIPSVLILVTLVGIVLWMLPPYREGFLEPMFQTFLARYGKYLVLAYISPKIPWAPLQRALKASTAAEYDEDGNHRGAISLQQNVSNRKKTPLGDVRIVTLSGHHAGDIKSIECTSSHGTIVSVGLEGEVVLWDGVRGKWVARLDRVQRRRDVKTFNADVNPDYAFGNSNTGTRFSTGSVRKVAILSPIQCIKIDHSNQWIASGHKNGVIRMWNISSSAWIREFVPTNTTKLNGHVQIGNEKENHQESNGKVKSLPHHNGVVTLNFISAFNPSESSAWDSPKVTRKHLAGKNQPPVVAPTYLIAAYEDGHVREWDLESGECVNAVQNDAKSSITQLLVTEVKPRSTHERQRIFAVSKDGNVTCYGRRSNNVDDIVAKPYWRHLYTIKEQNSEMVSSISAETSVDGTGIIVIGTEKGSVQVWNIANGRQLCALAEGQSTSRRDGKSGVSVRMPRRQESDMPHLRSSPSNEHNESTFLSHQSNHQSAIQHIAISRHCRSDQFISKGGKIDRCHRNEFLIASCAADGIVNIWRIDCSKGAAGDRCEQCGIGGNPLVYNHKKSSSSFYKSSDFSDTSHLQTNEGNREPITSLSEPSLTSGNSSTTTNNDQENGFDISDDHTPANMVDIEQLAMRLDDMRVSKRYLGRVCQPGGHGVTWLKSTILAGVRRTGSSDRHGSSASLGWEMWMAPMRKYEPHRRQRQSDSFGSSSSFYDVSSKYDVPVVTVNLNNDTEEHAGNEPENLGFVSRLLYTLFFNNGNSRPTRRRHPSATKTWRKSAINAARLQRVRRKRRDSSMASSRTESDALLEEEMHTKELLPFTNITCLKSLDGDGLAFDFGNFVKVVWLDEQPLMFTMNDIEPAFENESSSHQSLRSRHINTSNSKQNHFSELGSAKDHINNIEDREPLYLPRRSSSFTELSSRTRLPCGLQGDAPCRTASCDTDCSYKLKSHFPSVVNTIVSKKYN
ncbi:hypothetical protein INT44_005071 [Umbelopsis vinacea]|uniref:Sterol regulatory element-binding protein cleavage-activating protein n=1 Tax=Umbelopsis vinacea TaxID=44442 RepID=A0A8H7ULB3_9FUNG|nr:hypothetical protein INT44_005071 [Umbelopsis vinacea]